MTQTPVRTHEQSIVVEATPEALYDLVSDITRTGEWSPVCTACWWDDPDQAGQVGVWFTGHNQLPLSKSATLPVIPSHTITSATPV